MFVCLRTHLPASVHGALLIRDPRRAAPHALTPYGCVYVGGCSWFEHTLGWWRAHQRTENAGKILWLTYEELKLHNARALGRIAGRSEAAGANSAPWLAISQRP